MCHDSIHEQSCRPTGNMAVAAVNEASDVELPVDSITSSPVADSAYVRIPNTSKTNCRPSWYTPSVVRPEIKSNCVSVNASRSSDQYRTRPTVPRQYRIAVTTATGVEKQIRLGPSHVSGCPQQNFPAVNQPMNGIDAATTTKIEFMTFDLTTVFQTPRCRIVGSERRDRRHRGSVTCSNWAF